MWLRNQRVFREKPLGYMGYMSLPDQGHLPGVIKHCNLYIRGLKNLKKSTRKDRGRNGSTKGAAYQQ